MKIKTTRLNKKSCILACAILFCLLLLEIGIEVFDYWQNQQYSLRNAQRQIAYMSNLWNQASIALEESSFCDFTNIINKARSISHVQGSSDKSTLLHLACMDSGKEEMIRYLLEIGVSPNVTNALGRTPLHNAFIYNHECSYYSLLTNYNARCDVPDVFGKKPMDYYKSSVKKTKRLPFTKDL